MSEIKLKPICLIGLKDDKLMVQGNYDDKNRLINYLCDAIKIVSSYEPDKIIIPDNGRASFLRRK